MSGVDNTVQVIPQPNANTAPAMHPDVQVAQPLTAPKAVEPVANAKPFNPYDFARQRMAEKGLIAPEAAAASGTQFQPERGTVVVDDPVTPKPRDAVTGQFVAQATTEPTAEPTQEPASAPASDPAAAPAAPEAPAEPLVDVPGYGIKLPFSEALAVLESDRASAKAWLQNEQARQKAEIEAERAALAAEREKAQNIIALYQQSPDAVAAILGGSQDPSIFGGQPVQAPVANPQDPNSRPLTRAEIDAYLAERESKAQKAAAEQAEQQQLIQRFDSAVHEGFTSALSDREHTPQVVEAIGDLVKFYMSRDRAAINPQTGMPVFSPYAPPQVIKAQARAYALKAKQAILADHANKVERQKAVVQSAPVPIAEGGTLMPRSEVQSEFFQGPITPDKLRNRILDRARTNAASRGVQM